MKIILGSGGAATINVLVKLIKFKLQNLKSSFLMYICIYSLIENVVVNILSLRIVTESAEGFSKIPVKLIHE